MIGNVMIADSVNDIQRLMMMRNQFMSSYATACLDKGVVFIPNKVKIIVLNDAEPSGDDYIVGSILLPNSRAMFYLIEGDYNRFVEEYYNKLDSDPEIQEFIVILLAGLMERGFDYVFYFWNDDATMCYAIGNALFEYLYRKFGVVVTNNMNFMNPGIAPERVVDIQNLIRQYKLSNRPESLFIEF